MIKEGAYREEIPEQSIENGDAFSERSIKEFIESRHAVSNSGHNGIILKFLENELPPDIQHTVAFDRNENPEGSLSVKALKIYNRDDSHREFTALQRARRIVAENNNDASPLARVPKAHASYDMEISEKFQQFLNENGASLVDRKVGILIMDYIEGADLATLLYREALRRTWKDGDHYAPEEVEHMPFTDLYNMVGNKLHFAVPGGKSRDENERGFEEEKVKNENAEKLFATLEETGFVLPPAVLEQVRGTVQAFHKNNFYHNDLHERQIILKDGDLENPQAFIIDYGTASEKRLTAEEGKRIMNDDAIVRRLERLTRTAEEREKGRLEARVSEWNDRIATITNQARFGGQLRAVAKAVETDDQRMLESQLSYSSSSDTDLKNFLSMLIKTSREHPEWNGRIVDFLSAHERDTKKRPFFAGQLKQAKEAIG